MRVHGAREGSCAKNDHRDGALIHEERTVRGSLPAEVR